MSTQRVLLMLFVTVAVAWMVGYAEGKHAADRWWQANWDNYARSGSHWHGQQSPDCKIAISEEGIFVAGCYLQGKVSIGPDNVYTLTSDYRGAPSCFHEFTPVPCPKEQPKQ